MNRPIETFKVGDTWYIEHAGSGRPPRPIRRRRMGTRGGNTLSIKDLLDRVNFFLRWFAGQYAVVIGAFMAWQAGLPMDVSVQIGQAKFKFVAQEKPEPGVRRRLRIDELE